jgi:hypothetical protein
MKKTAITVAIVASVATIVCGLIIAHLCNENQRLKRNQHTLLSDVELYKTRAGESAASIEVLQLTLNEFREHRAEDAQRIKELGIKLRRAESYALSATQSNYGATLPLRDTIIMRDTIRDTVKVFEGGDTWSTISGSVTEDSIAYSLRSVDTLYQVVHRVPRKFWFIRFGTKAIRQEIVSSNPNTQLVYSEYIELKRRKRR